MKNLKSKYVFIFTLFTILSSSIHSQDLIITSEGDSLNCKITRIKADNIYFTFKYKEEIRSTLIPLNQVKYYQYNYFQTEIVPAEKVIGNEIFPHFRVAINGGFSYRLAKLGDDISSDLEDYIKELKSGHNYGFDLSYYFSEQIGIGFRYCVFKSKHELYPIIVTLPNGTSQYAKMSDNISINFIGPSLSTRLLNADKKNCFLFTLGMGYMGYKDKALLITDFTIKGSSLGLCWDIGYDISFTENLALGFQFTYLIGILKQYELSDGSNTETIKLEKDNYESLSRVDLSIGLRFNK